VSVCLSGQKLKNYQSEIDVAWQKYMLIGEPQKWLDFGDL